MNDLVDIIMPVYNMEKYLNRAIESVLSQTYENFRLLAINDGSTDSSLHILEGFQKKDSRIEVFSQSNKGVSAARNKGLKYIKGKYVCFLDPDDYLSKDYLFSLVSDIKNNQSDISVCYFRRFYDDGKEEFPKELKSEVQTRDDFLKDFFLEDNKGGGYIWNKLFSSQVIKDISFSEEIRVGEDVKFLFDVVFISNKISTIPKVCYNYYMRVDSASRTPSAEEVFLESKICENMYRKVCETKNHELILFALKRYVRQIASYLVIASGEQSYRVKNIQKEIKPLFWKMIRIQDVSALRKLIIFIKIYFPNFARKSKVFNSTYSRQ